MSGIPIETEMNLNQKLQQIEKVFTPDCLVTLIVRKPGNDEADLMLTKDTVAGVRGVVDRMQERGMK